MKVLVTGATGLLGRAVYRAFSATHNRAVSSGSGDSHEVLGTGFSRFDKVKLRQDERCRLVRVDVTSASALVDTIDDFAPDVIVHCAAERRPDVAEKLADETQHLNAEIPGFLAGRCRERDILLIYISTDYVFDGTSPPYNPSSKASPVNFYGKTKYAGEEAVRAHGTPGKSVSLRVPVLYGETLSGNDESAINILLDATLNQEKQTKMDNYAIRYPTNVSDVARAIVRLAEYHRSNLKKQLPSIMHFSGRQHFTKYEICALLATILGLPSPPPHLSPQSEAPAPEEATTRPRDCCLLGEEGLKEWSELGIDVNTVDFEAWWKANLLPRR